MDPIVGWFVFVIGGFLGVAVVMTQGFCWKENRRKEALARVAQELGWSFKADAVNWSDAQDLPVAALAEFVLFQLGSPLEPQSQKMVSNVMRGRINQWDVLLFDYFYYERTHYDTPPHSTVAVFQLPGSNLPTFELRPRSVLDKFSWLVRSFRRALFHSSRSVICDSYTLYLYSGDRRTVQALFEGEICHLLKGQQGWYLEARQDWLIVHRKTLKAEEIRGFLDSATSLCTFLLKH